jgi:hypothetical protein
METISFNVTCQLISLLAMKEKIKKEIEQILPLCSILQSSLENTFSALFCSRGGDLSGH